MKRREFITLLGGAAIGLSLCPGVLAQARQVRIGFLAPVSPTPAMWRAFREGLRERGYIEGQNLSIESFAQNPGLAGELVRSNIDVIVAWTTPAVAAARKATSTIPIVMVGVSNPVEVGFIANLARPGGNITGVTNIASDLGAKLVELLNEIVPGTRHIGIIFNPSNPGSVLQISATENGVRALGLRVSRAEANDPDGFRRAFRDFSADGVNAVVLLADASLVDHAPKIAELARTARLPTAFQRRENVEAGGLFSYGPNLAAQLGQTAVYVDRILKGANPAEVPVEQPTKFELVINLTAAKAIGLTVPPTLIARADEVIE